VPANRTPSPPCAQTSSSFTRGTSPPNPAGIEYSKTGPKNIDVVAGIMSGTTGGIDVALCRNLCVKHAAEARTRPQFVHSLSGYRSKSSLAAMDASGTAAAEHCGITGTRRRPTVHAEQDAVQVLRT